MKLLRRSSTAGPGNASTRKRHFARSLALAVAVLTVPALAACSSATPEADGSAAADLPVLSFGVLRAPTGALAVITDEHKWFQKAGVSVDFKSFAEGGGPAIIQAMAGGTPDIALLNMATAVLAIGQGTIDVQIVGIPDDPADALPLLATSAIKTVEDLKGKKVSTPGNGGQYFLLTQILKAHGMTIKDVQFKPLPVGDAQAAFISGSLDAVISSANGTVLIKNAAPTTKVLASGNKLGGTATKPAVNPDVLVATKAAIKDKPEAIQAFIKAYHDNGIAYLTNKKTKEKAIKEIGTYMKSVGAGVDETNSSQASVNSIKFYSYDEAQKLLSSKSFQASVETQGQYWFDAGVLKTKPDLTKAVNAKMMPAESK